MSHKWISITKEEAHAFCARYQRPLQHNYYMDSHSWHDFSLGEAHESFVLMGDINYDRPDDISYRIREDLYGG